MSSKSVDREAPVQGAVIIHPEHEGRDSSRASEARLEEAAGLALALDLEVRDALIAPLRKRTPATLFGKGKVSSLLGEVGKGITSFKKGVSEGQKEVEDATAEAAKDVTPEEKEKDKA